MARKHVATGNKPPGGKREGAGRPLGSVNLLEYGETSAIRAMKLRVPAAATDEQAELAGESLETLIKVMRGEIKGADAPTRRNAAKDVREEICGPVAKQVNLAGPDGGALQVSIAINRTVAPRSGNLEPENRVLAQPVDELADPEDLT